MPRIRALIVDDAVVMRKLITEALARDPDIEVVGTAANGRIGLQKITQVNPDIVTLDVEMPDMNGLEMLREVRRTHPKLPIIMFSTLTRRGAEATLDAISAGATDYVTKPANVGSVNESIARLEQELIPKIKTHCRAILPSSPQQGSASSGAQRSATAARPGGAVPPRLPRPANARIEVVCIGTSTGGPNALADVLPLLPAHFPVPIVIVQHMPPVFTGLLAERLGKRSQITFHEGAEGDLLRPGHAYIAPGGKHMTVQRTAAGLVLGLNEDPPENSCRPAVDVLFRSVAATCGVGTLGVVLTGMGQDGAHGCRHIRERQGLVIAQDQATSVVWGMPGAVVEAGVADRVLPIQQVATEIMRIVGCAATPSQSPMRVDGRVGTAVNPVSGPGEVAA
jgi:two-component system, chemotaxis family, protein-glutamate methylesterase/glutaminase